MLKLGVLVSGSGTNLQAIIDRINDGYLDKCTIEAVISSRSDAFALERAKKHNIPAYVVKKSDFADKEAYSEKIMQILKQHAVDLIVLAGFLSMLGENIVREYHNRIINVHPSLIPAFSGKGCYGIIPHQKAIEYGVKITGATVHFVDSQYDTGPIILQKAVNVHSDDTPESLQKRVMQEAEWNILPEAIKLISEGRVRVEGRKVHIELILPEKQN